MSRLSECDWCRLWKPALEEHVIQGATRDGRELYVCRACSTEVLAETPGASRINILRK